MHVGDRARGDLRASSRSLPNIFTPTSERMPVVSMSMRLMIGIVQMFDTPGSWTAAAHLRAEALQRHAGTPLRLAASDARCVSVMFSGAGSVDVSARADLRRRHTPLPGTHRGRAFCVCGDARVLLERDARVRDRHEHQVALVQRRHELAADAAREEQRASEQQRRGARWSQARCASAASSTGR